MPRSPKPTERYTWNTSAGRYTDTRTGRFVSRDIVRLSLDRARNNAALRVVRDANALRAGKFTIGDWETKTRANLKDLHTYSAAVARGGFAQLTSGDLSTISNSLKREFTYLNRLSHGLESGDVADTYLVSRMRMYVKAARRTHHKIERKAMRDAGKTREWNVLGISDHCDGVNSCPAETARGKVPLGSISDIGTRRCLSNCNCFIEYD